jgi:GIY-YIG catalytic domain-containing protein
MLLKPARSGKARAGRSPTGKSARIIASRCKFPEALRKDPPQIPRASGIYFIVCKATGQFYVGSAVDLFMRKRTHWNTLRGGKHTNKYLQRAWRTHGEVNFEFRVVELVRPSRLLATEQSWLDKTRCIDRSIGFNILPRALSCASAAVQPRKGFFDPLGRPVVIRNLHKFCRQHRLGFLKAAPS